MKASMIGTCSSQGLEEVLRLQGGHDAPALRDRRGRRAHIGQRLWAANGRVEDIGRGGVPELVTESTRAGPAQERAQNHVCAAIAPCPDPRRSVGELFAQGVGHVFREPAEAAFETAGGKLAVEAVEVDLVEVGNQHRPERGD